MISSVLRRFGLVVGAVLLSTELFAAEIHVTTAKEYSGWVNISQNGPEIWYVEPGGSIVVNNYGGNQYISIENRDSSELCLQGGTISSGTFTPLSPYCFNVRLLDGAKIDLSASEMVWPLESNVTYDTIGAYTTHTAFADKATILVDLGARMVKSGDPVIAWQKANKPVNGVRFKLVSGSGSLQICDEGLYLRRGFVMVVR